MNKRYDDAYFAGVVDFDTAMEAEYCHTYKSMKDIVNNPRIKDICWLDDIDGTDEIINCTVKENNKDFNVLVAKSLFDYEDFKKWCIDNIDKIWKDERHPNNIRGINYF